MNDIYGFRTVGSETTVSTVAGNANRRLIPSLPKRSGLLVCNEDGTLELRVRLVPRGAAAPAYASGRSVLRIPAGSSAVILASESVDVYVCNSSNAGTTSTVTHQDFAY